LDQCRASTQFAIDENGNVYCLVPELWLSGSMETPCPKCTPWIADFVDYNIRIMQISAGVDMSMAVDTKETVRLGARRTEAESV
jgi:hypothetical protein